jgi:hypothetical protein
MGSAIAESCDKLMRGGREGGRLLLGRRIRNAGILGGGASATFESTRRWGAHSNMKSEGRSLGLEEDGKGGKGGVLITPPGYKSPRQNQR